MNQKNRTKSSPIDFNIYGSNAIILKFDEINILILLFSSNTLYIDIESAKRLNKPISEFTNAKYINLCIENTIDLFVPKAWLDYTLNKWRAEWLLEEENTEYRMMLIKVIGYKKIMEDLSSELIHKETDSFGNEMELRKISQEVDLEDIFLLKLVCPSTNKTHILRVPPKVKTCDEAKRWTFFDTDLNFLFIKETEPIRRTEVLQ